MKLAIREMVTGDPEPGDRLKLWLGDKTKLKFVYEPHGRHYAFGWRLVGKHPKGVADFVEKVSSERKDTFSVYLNLYSIGIEYEAVLILLPDKSSYVSDDFSIKLGEIIGIDING